MMNNECNRWTAGDANLPDPAELRREVETELIMRGYPLRTILEALYPRKRGLK